MTALDELIRDFAPVEADDDAERAAAEFARRSLREAVAHERRPPRRRRLTMPFALVGGLAALILAAVALLPSHGANAPAPASAAVVLERAARVATEQTDGRYPGRHQYLYLKFREGWTTGMAPPGRVEFFFRTTDTQQDWVAPNGSGRQREIYDGPARFLTARDRAAWVAAGRPGLVPPAGDGTYPAGGYPAGNQLDPVGLPTDPARLLQAIVKRFEGGRLRADQTFNTVGTLLQDSGSPTLRAALYRVAARLPGVRLLGTRRDVLGRHGVAVGLAGGGVLDELIFDPATSDVLEWAQVQIAGPEHVPAGTVLHYFAYQGRGVVNSIDDLPGGGRLPYRPRRQP